MQNTNEKKDIQIIFISLACLRIYQSDYVSVT